MSYTKVWSDLDPNYDPATEIDIDVLKADSELNKISSRHRRGSKHAELASTIEDDYSFDDGLENDGLGGWVPPTAD